MAGDASGHAASAAAAPPPAFELEAPARESDATHGFREYYGVLARNRHFRLLWAAEMIDNVGSWLSYVATLELASQLSGGSGLALSAVVLIRFLPSLALAPVCGVVADRVNRVKVLIAAAAADAAVMLLLALVPLAPRGAQVALLYLLLALQFSATGFYEPARKALVPVLVPASELHLAATVDSWAWSLTGAVGASAGGLVASRLGKSACFLVDAVTYLIAAWCALQLPVSLGAPDALARDFKKSSSFRQAGPGREAEEEAEEAENGSLHGLTVTHAERRHHHHQQQQQKEKEQKEQPQNGQKPGQRAAQQGGQQHWPSPRRQQPLQPLAREPAGAGQPLAAADAVAEVTVLHEHDSEGHSRLLPQGANGSAPAGPGAKTPAHNGSSSGLPGAEDGSSGGGLLEAAKAALAEGSQATREGWQYASSPSNRDVLALVMMKCAAGLVWGAIDILNVKWSEMGEIQVGDASTTLGLIFAAVGLGCFVGPVALNAVIPPHTRALRWGVAASYALFAAGLLVMLLAPSISLVLLSTIVRSMGSAALWVYSTLLMQKRVPNSYLGRMSAVESALYTICETASSVFGGAAFDVLHLSLHQLLLVLTATAVVEAAGWSAYAWWANRGREGGGRAAYLPVRQQEAGDGEE